MAYQPPTKSTYGDELTLDDKWNSSQSTDSYGYSDNNFGNQTGPLNKLPSPPTPVFDQPNNNYQPYERLHKQTNQPLPLSSRESFREVARSLTQEDLLFMKQWQRDSFYYRGRYDQL